MYLRAILTKFRAKLEVFYHGIQSIWRTLFDGFSTSATLTLVITELLSVRRGGSLPKDRIILLPPRSYKRTRKMVDEPYRCFVSKYASSYCGNFDFFRHCWPLKSHFAY